MNPEFHRNLLLDLTLHRLIAMPLILVLIYVAGGLTGQAGLVSYSAWMVMIALLVVWGTRLAAEAVLGEVAARTWDSQRMSAIGPFAMSWAKLAGSTIYVWYGAALSVPALLYKWERGLDDLLQIVIVGLLAQAVALLVSLLVQRMRPASLRFQVTASQLFGIASALAYWNILSERRVGPFPYGASEWYGWILDKDIFPLATGIAFLAWACFGVYRLMRAELQFRSWPVGWTAFALFSAFYVGGFSPAWESYSGFVPGAEFLLPRNQAMRSTDFLERLQAAFELWRLLVVYVVILVLIWIGAFVEPKGFVRLRRWGSSIATGNIRRILESTPAWVPALLAGLVVGAVFLAAWALSPDVQADLRKSGMGSLGAFAVALFLFLLRDIGVIHVLTLDGRKRRAHLTALVYLVVLYILLPILLAVAGWEGALPVFVPFAVGHPLLIILPVLVQIGIVAGLFGLRWQRVARSMAST